MVGADRGQTSTGKASGSGSQARLTRYLFIFLGDCMAAKRMPKAKRKTSKTNSQPSQAASMLSMATHNLVNMVAVTTVSGAVLLTLLAIRHF
jgi:hypothetical protein